MTTTGRTQIPENKEELGELLRQARLEAGYTCKSLANMSGVPQSQIAKLEGAQILRPNPVHLAALAEPLGLTLYQVYAAAGYKTPSAISHLGAELEDKLRQLPPAAVERLERYVDQLVREHQPTTDLTADQPLTDA